MPVSAALARCFQGCSHRGASCPQVDHALRNRQRLPWLQRLACGRRQLHAPHAAFSATAHRRVALPVPLRRCAAAATVATRSADAVVFFRRPVLRHSSGRPAQSRTGGRQASPDGDRRAGALYPTARPSHGPDGMLQAHRSTGHHRGLPARLHRPGRRPVSPAAIAFPTLRPGRAGANPAPRGARPEAGATDLIPRTALQSDPAGNLLRRGLVFPIKILGTVSRALASEYKTRRWPRRAFRRGLPYGVFLSRFEWDTGLAYTVVYPIPSVCQHAQPSTPNAEGNPRNQPEISVRRSTAKTADHYSNSILDLRNRFTMLGDWALPFAKGSKGFAAALAKDWGVNAVVVLTNGIPFDITNASARSNTGGSDRPNVIGDPTTGFTQSPSAWFNTKAFAAQPANTYGNLGRNVLHAPGRTSLDLAIHREFTPREGMHLQFRFETFNLTNTPPFAAPNAGFGNANFGTITSAGLPRNVQVALKLLF